MTSKIRHDVKKFVMDVKNYVFMTSTSSAWGKKYIIMSKSSSWRQKVCKIMSWRQQEVWGGGVAPSFIISFLDTEN